MDRRFLAVLVLVLFQHSLKAQLPFLEKLQLIDSSKHISEPYEIEKELISLMDNDTIVLITFSKTTGVMLSHALITKKAVITDLITTGFKLRYFVLINNNQAIFYLDD